LSVIDPLKTLGSEFWGRGGGGGFVFIAHGF
jgi:hypothetical protein